MLSILRRTGQAFSVETPDGLVKVLLVDVNVPLQLARFDASFPDAPGKTYLCHPDQVATIEVASGAIRLLTRWLQTDRARLAIDAPREWRISRDDKTAN